MRLLGSHFVLGQTIEEALDRAGSQPEWRFSYDMLGEGARTQDDADRYFESYANAIAAIGSRAGNSALPDRPGISVKLSALHPRYEATSRERVMSELVPKLLQLAQKAKGFDLNFTVDAEEADRLELSLDVIAATLADPSLRGWDGFGLAVQAYQKRAPQVIDWLVETATALDRKLMVRLVKGAYWDTEIKRAQERGLADYPVFTRKAMTDLCYMDCARRLLAARPRIFPQFATHNALTVASVIEAAGGVDGLEFQRLHGMGEALYVALRAEIPQAACRIYAPVGGHRDLLAYLVRRLLENGANTSFVSVVRRSGRAGGGDPAAPARSSSEGLRMRVNGKILLPRDLYGVERMNSPGVEFGDRASLDALLAELRAAAEPERAAPLIDGVAQKGAARDVRSPIDGAVVGRVIEADVTTAGKAIDAAAKAFRPGRRVP